MENEERRIFWISENGDLVLSRAENELYYTEKDESGAVIRETTFSDYRLLMDVLWAELDLRGFSYNEATKELMNGKIRAELNKDNPDGGKLSETLLFQYLIDEEIEGIE